MFTGIIQSIGKIESVLRKDQDLSFTFSLGENEIIDIDKINLGDSIAVNGVCLTAVEFNEAANSVLVDVSKETIDKTLVGDFSEGALVNLELALKAGDHLGGHLVTGHVDGIAELVQQYPEGDSVRLVFRLSEKHKSHGLAKYIAEKGSVCIDGVSLTVNHVKDSTEEGGYSEFGINIVPHTLEQTIIGQYIVGQRVHLEIDVIARYLQRQIDFNQAYS